MLPTRDSPTLAVPRITADKFKEILKEKNSPAISESLSLYNLLVRQGVDPSFALAQFRVESQMGTAGYAKITGSWGNMLHDDHLTISESGVYSPGNGYTYATYENYIDAMYDYCKYIHWYKDQYQLDTIYKATARWLGKVPGVSGHISYVNTIISDMIAYENPEGTFYEAGDKMIYAGKALDKNAGKLLQKYFIEKGTELYRGTNNDLLKLYSGTPGHAWWLGYVNGGTSWGAVVIGTSLADVSATILYIKNPSAANIIKV